MQTDYDYLFRLAVRTFDCSKAINFYDYSSLSLKKKANLMAGYTDSKCVSRFRDSKLDEELSSTDNLVKMMRNSNLSLFGSHSKSNTDSHSLLLEALKLDNLEFLKILLFDQGRDFSQTNSEGKTALEVFDTESPTNRTSAFLSTLKTEEPADWLKAPQISFESNFADLHNKILKAKLTLLQQESPLKMKNYQTNYTKQHSKALNKALFDDLLKEI